MIFTPCDFRRVGVQVLTADMMVLAKLGATRSRKVGLRLIGARAVLAERDRVIDAAHVVVSMQRVPRG